MNELTTILVIGFITLGIYKVIELLAKRKERLMFIEKLFTHCEKKDISDSIRLPDISFGKQSGSSALKIALLLMGVGTGCLLTFFTIRYCGNSGYANQSLICLSYISIFGGLGLFISYLIESKQSKK
jgi:hypothetical protein